MARVWIATLWLMLLQACASPSLNLTSEQIVEHTSNSMVRITIVAPDGVGQCSGYHIGANQIATAHHCIREDAFYQFQDNKGNNYEADIVWTDETRDFALFQLQTDFQGDELTIAAPDYQVKRGEPIFSFGYPWYYPDLTFESGYVKDIARVYGRESIISNNIAYSGESGGPVISLRTGEVVGYVVMTSEQVQWFADPNSVHYTISLIVSHVEIYRALESPQVVSE